MYQQSHLLNLQKEQKYPEEINLKLGHQLHQITITQPKNNLKELR